MYIEYPIRDFKFNLFKIEPKITFPPPHPRPSPPPGICTSVNDTLFTDLGAIWKLSLSTTHPYFFCPSLEPRYLFYRLKFH